MTLYEYVGTLKGHVNIDVYCAVSQDETGVQYYESVGALSTTYEAATLDELLNKVDHMLLASTVVSKCIDTKL